MALPDIEINNYDGKPYSSIRIRHLNFVGIIDWSPSRVFGLAVGNEIGGKVKSAIFFEAGIIKWALEVCNPLDVQLCNEGIGAFLDPLRLGEVAQLWVFYQGGLLFRVECNAAGGLKSISVSPSGILAEFERRRLLYSMSGSLLSEEKLMPPRRRP